jgi:hypothetical protein
MFGMLSIGTRRGMQVGSFAPLKDDERALLLDEGEQALHQSETTGMKMLYPAAFCNSAALSVFSHVKVPSTSALGFLPK